MLLQLAGALFLCGFVPVEVEGFSPTLIERGIRDLANLYIKGDIELDDLVSSLAVFREDDLQLARGVLPLVEELRDQETVLVHHPSKKPFQGCEVYRRPYRWRRVPLQAPVSCQDRV